MAFDPFAYLTKNRMFTPTTLAAMIQFYNTNNRPPTLAEAEAIVGPTSTTPAYTDPLPDGFAGRDWDNPNWVQRLRNKNG